MLWLYTKGMLSRPLHEGESISEPYVDSVNRR